jgi:glycosyltransferase involved in cell wall biosynthesis
MILLVSANFPPEPVAAACLSYDLALSLSEKNKVTVIAPRPSRPFGFSFRKELPDHKLFEHIVLNSYTCPKSKVPGRMYESYSFGKHTLNFIRENHDKIKCIYISAWPLLAQYMLVKASRKYAIPAVIHVQDIYPESLSNKIPFLGQVINRALLPLDRYILRNASHIVANSEYMRASFEKTRGIAGNRITVVKNWQDESKFIMDYEMHTDRKNHDSGDRRFIFMYLGNIGPVAGVDFLIKSFIKADIKEAILVIAGAGSQKEKCMQISRHENRNIVFTDVPAGKVAEMQSSSDVLLLPVRKGASLSSIPSKLPAYMFSKKPIIACVENESDIAYDIRKSDCGWVVPPEDTDSLIKAMKSCISMPREDLRIIGERGFSYALDNYSRRKNLSVLTSIIMLAMKNIHPSVNETCF